MKKVMIFAAAAAIAIGAGGCMFGRVKSGDKNVVMRAAQIKAGETRASELYRILDAEPSMRMPTGKGTALYAYNFMDSKTKGLTLMVVNFMKTNVKNATMYVEVDENADLVKKVHIPSTESMREPEWEFWPFGK